MQNRVFSIDLGWLSESVLLETLIKSFFKPTQLKKQPYFVQYRTSFGVVNLYTSGKVVFQGDFKEEFLRNWLAAVLDRASLDFDCFIGGDEAGKGESIGGLSVAVVKVRKESLPDLMLMGVTDSKRLDAARVFRIAGFLMERFEYAEEYLTSEEFNVYWAKLGNLNKLLDKLYGNLVKKISPCKGCNSVWLVIDKYSSTARSYNSILSRATKTGSCKVKFDFLTKGERYPWVAAASVIARYNFLKRRETDTGFKDYKNV